MPDMKEKLVELLTDCEAKGYWSYGTDCKTGEHGGHEMTAEDIADYLAENIVDAVEVVQCCNCSYWNPRYETMGMCMKHNSIVTFTKPDFYCAWGERKNNGVCKKD